MFESSSGKPSLYRNTWGGFVCGFLFLRLVEGDLIMCSNTRTNNNTHFLLSLEPAFRQSTSHWCVLPAAPCALQEQFGGLLGCHHPPACGSVLTKWDFSSAEQIVILLWGGGGKIFQGTQKCCSTYSWYSETAFGCGFWWIVNVSISKVISTPCGKSVREHLPKPSQGWTGSIRLLCFSLGLGCEVQHEGVLGLSASTWCPCLGGDM